MQHVLRMVAKNSHLLMGVGGGADVSSSGEQVCFSKLQERSPGPYTIFDVGANVGTFVALAKKSLLGSDCTLHCFEPGKTTFETLQTNVGPGGKVILNNFGLGKAKGSFTLHYDSPGSGMASLTQRKLDYRGIDFNLTETVQIETLDDYCDEQGIETIDFLKIDIEGHELEALQGATRKFEQEKIDLVAFEFGGCNIDTRTYFRDFFEFFSDQKMLLFRITPSGYLLPMKKYHERNEQFTTMNYLAIRRP